ncbi:UDP-N-acetylmuramate dehydrogenase [Flavobacterium sp. NKUCC04_CG]|uniref:UDP-N-acetylmuramate dehydrogenase n=1 Tax=Flavobacterium sp. NKUCC04_CG TaxID=2842121 RepID=UPI001C5BE880|nr:UDP-N-acetylmuramate dehydrogenase [Flavobacterium sp. NKUCC04_CG]MBW3519373.1 UDP-N-acetylmuramate dehydrogenase [Flavobacterium sp. NKUCC04_CG]
MIPATDVSLKELNTFGIDVKAKRFIVATQTEQLLNLLKEYRDDTLFFLGGGSNMLLTKDIEALVIQLAIKGKKILREDDDFAWVEAQVGENWHEFVLWTLEHDLGGLENLSLIPGQVGTTPIQNIGAYGVEIKDQMVECVALRIKDLELVTFSNKQCAFDYRESVFKNELKDQYIVLSVVFKLTKGKHNLKIEYGAIQSELDKNKITHPTIQDVSKAVIAIRESKLPNPKEIGNSGSFFKNPIISTAQFNKLQATYPEIPSYRINDELVKVPAGWLIEQAGFKGKRFGDAGVHSKQALVLVNYGKATGLEIAQLASTIQKAIFEKFNIKISAEVNIF